MYWYKIIDYAVTGFCTEYFLNKILVTQYLASFFYEYFWICDTGKCLMQPRQLEIQGSSKKKWRSRVSIIHNSLHWNHNDNHTKIDSMVETRSQKHMETRQNQDCITQ